MIPRLVLLFGALSVVAAEFAPEQAAKRSAAPSAGACDFQSSFMTWDLPPRPDRRGAASRHRIPLGNKARIQLEALIDVVNEATGASERFVLIAPCRTEWVYADEGLFQLPSNEYRFIFSLREMRSVGRGLTVTGEPSRAALVSGFFRSLRIDVRTFARSRLLRTPSEINAASEANLPLVGRTEIRDPQRKERYVIEYPIKTMNFRPEAGSYQVDTGPLLVADSKSTAASVIERLEMAHIAYNHNRLDRAEFILRRPTSIPDKGGREVARVLHYTDVQAFPAVTQIFAGDAK
jgi:hypothetical protein